MREAFYPGWIDQKLGSLASLIVPGACRVSRRKEFATLWKTMGTLASHAKGRYRAEFLLSYCLYDL